MVLGVRPLPTIEELLAPLQITRLTSCNTSQMTRSRWHVPLQTLGFMLAIVGYFLGHKHKGRQFAPSAHAAFASIISLMLAAQVLIGIYLKLHFNKAVLGRVRHGVVVAHGVLGKALPVAAWVQMLFGGIAAAGYCRDDHLGQCLAHFIMGSAFIAYGIITVILLLVGQVWLRRTGRSQEFFDSLVIMLWGCVNTFTEHRWGQPWRGNDLQHTTMGIVWWCAGLLGMWLSRKRDGAPRRNIIPALVIVLTGWAMGAHPQHLPISTMVHTVFGYTLMAAGAARVIEISFVLRDKSSINPSQPEEANSFQFLIPFVSTILQISEHATDLPQLLMASGFLFMGATEEQMEYLSNLNVTHVSYILILFSITFLLFLFVSLLLHLYAQSMMPLPSAQRSNGGGVALPNSPMDTESRSGPSTNGPTRRTNHKNVTPRDAEEFELEGLISDDDGERGLDGSSEPSEDSGTGRRKEGRVQL